MDDDQQFCLRWNNHQSTLVAVFDTLLENGTLVDCTLAAEGKFLNAHKVVLSACSPYFEALLSKHFDKHPILILKDVKFQELKAMMDYMYRGEVNISQDQLGALLKAAESLQIKGLSDNRKGETERKPAPAPPPPKSPQPASTLPKVQGLTIEQRARDDSREGSISPGPRKKKRLRRKSEELDNHDASNSSESHSLPAQNIPTLPAVTKMNADVPEQVETKSEILTRHKQTDEMPQVPIIKEKIETHTELMLEPKSEYVDEMNEDSIEDLTLDDDDLSNMEQMDDGAGPSHGNTGEGSSQGFGGWHMGNQSQDEVFLAAQEAVGAHRDSQGKTTRFTQTRVIKMVDRSTQKELRKDKKRSHKKSEGTDLKVIKKKKVLSILKKKKHVIQSFLDDEAEKLQKQVAVQSMLSKEAKVVLQTPVINRAMRSRSNSVKSEPGHIASSSRPSSSCSYNYNKPYNYGRSCEACILLKESGKFACQGCQRKSSILNEPPNKVYNYGKTCEACKLLKEQGKYACPACQEKFLLTMYNYGKNCDVCQLFKDSGKYACGRCQKLPNNSKNKSKKNKTEGGSHKKSHKKNKKKKSAASVESISLNEDNQATTSENNNEDNIEVENDDDEDDEFIEYVSLRDLLNGNEK